MDWNVANESLYKRFSCRVVNYDGAWQAVMQVGPHYASMPVNLHAFDVDRTLSSLLLLIEEKPQAVPSEQPQLIQLA